jgi:hypothetical protein
MNPLCWNVLLLETNGDHYLVRRAEVASTPVLLSASECSLMSMNQPTTVQLTQVTAPGSAGVRWLGEFGMSKTVLARLVAGHCDAAALMQFARVPFVAESGHEWVIGDLRFPGGRGGGLADIDVRPDSRPPCQPTPPWTPPRADLLR